MNVSKQRHMLVQVTNTRSGSFNFPTLTHASPFPRGGLRIRNRPKQYYFIIDLSMLMMISMSWNFPMLLLFLVVFPFSYSFACTFTVTNYCPYTIWPGTLAGSGTPQLPTTGFQLNSGQSVRIPAVPGWSGRLWARTGCTFDATGVGSCQTGDCGGRLECDGMGATPPASLFEITLGAGDDLDFYDVSIVDGYNLPLIAVPQGVNGKCNATGCVTNINMGCPKELQVVGGEEGEGNGNVVACKSACGAFGSDQFCCSGEFANPSTCRPSFYSTIFKRACPRAYSYAFDDGTSTFTCKAYDYTIIFCPVNRMKETNTTLTSPPKQESRNGKIVETVASSSTILQPFTILILLIITSYVNQQPHYRGPFSILFLLIITFVSLSYL